MPRFAHFAATAALLIASSLSLADEGRNESGQRGNDDRRYHDQKESKDKDHRDKDHRDKDRKDKDRKDKDRKENWEHKDRRGSDHDTYFHRRGYTRLNIPPGHYPPPGECRVWFPDRPPGHQPPPQKCDRIPPGAWVIRHPRNLPGHVHVHAYDPQRPGVVLAVGEFEIASGGFVRVIVTQ